MQNIAQRAFRVLAAFSLCASFVAACASAPAVPLPREELDGAKYKLVVISGRMDSRVVQFKVQSGGVVGVLVDEGKILSQLVGLPANLEMFKLRPVQGTENAYEGIFVNYQPDGSRAESEVKLTFNKDNFVWNLESATWERVQE